MYLSEPKFSAIVMRQFRFKMNANASVFTKLIPLQFFFLFMNSSYGSLLGPGTGTISVHEQHFTITSITGATWLWAFIVGISLTSTAQRNGSFTFVTNRFSYHGANFLFMLSASFIGGITTVLMGFVLKLYSLLRFEDVIIQSQGLITAPAAFFLQVLTAIAYTMLFFILSYTLSMFVHLNKSFLILFVVGWLSMTFINSTWTVYPYINQLFTFFSHESSIIIFLLKIVVTVFALFAISISVTNRLEVKR